MKKFIATVLAVALLLLPLIGVSEPVTKVLSLDLCSDWMLVKYADRSQVLALSPLVHRFPVDWITEDWPVHNGTLEQILELNPQLVIVGQYNANQLRQRLQELGVRVEVLALPQTLQQITVYEQRLLTLLGQPLSKASMPTEVIQTRADEPRLLLLGANGIGTGRNTFEQGILQRAGWRNYIETEGYVRLDLEQLVVDPPEAILWAAPGAAAMANQFAEHPALQQALPKERWLHTDYWRWQCPGPWTWELIEQLAQWKKH